MTSETTNRQTRAKPARRNTVTPARAAQLETLTDEPETWLTSTRALTAVLTLYIVCFGFAVIESIRHITQPVEPSGSNIPLLVTTATLQVALAILALKITMTVLHIPRSLAGIPSRTASNTPTILTALLSAAGLITAQKLIDALQPEQLFTNGPAGSWMFAAGLEDINAGIVEEFILVAIPALLLRRAGWHPAAIIALSTLMRWSFHLHYGPLTTIPWTLIWAGANISLFLWLRRLWPLVLVHTAWDLYADLGQAL